MYIFKQKSFVLNSYFRHSHAQPINIHFKQKRKTKPGRYMNFPIEMDFNWDFTS